MRKIWKKYSFGSLVVKDKYHAECKKLSLKELAKTPNRYDVINHLLHVLNRDTNYLEIGVRNPALNFDKIEANEKYSVDPGIEFKENPVDFKMTSDAFFECLKKGEVLNSQIKFDVIFIDGLHLAEQVDRDIENALTYIKEDGFIVLHDCNPPTEWHAREEHQYRLSPAGNNWNGTTWKAFVKARQRKDVFSCCVDTDWGVGILSKTQDFQQNELVFNPFYEFHVFQNKRANSLGLISFENLSSILANKELT